MAAENKETKTKPTVTTNKQKSKQNKTQKTQHIYHALTGSRTNEPDSTVPDLQQSGGKSLQASHSTK